MRDSLSHTITCCIAAHTASASRCFMTTCAYKHGSPTSPTCANLLLRISDGTSRHEAQRCEPVRTQKQALFRHDPVLALVATQHGGNVGQRNVCDRGQRLVRQEALVRGHQHVGKRHEARKDIVL